MRSEQKRERQRERVRKEEAGGKEEQAGGGGGGHVCVLGGGVGCSCVCWPYLGGLLSFSWCVYSAGQRPTTAELTATG